MDKPFMRGFPFWVNAVAGVSSSEGGALRLSDIFAYGAEEDAWESVLLANYMIDVEWLLDEAPGLLLVQDRLVLLSGEKGTATHTVNHDEGGTSYQWKGKAHANVNPFLRAARTAGLPPERVAALEPRLPLPFGTHHTKAALLVNRRGLRVAIFTANFVHADWNAKTQGIYVQDFPRRQGPVAVAAAAPPTSPADPFRGPADMAVDYALQLRVYLERCGVVSLPLGQEGPLGLFNTAFLDAFDFSAARVRLIASVPGAHEGPAITQFGMGRLADVQSRTYGSNATPPPACLSWQYSSQGSLDETFLGCLQRAMLGQLGLPPTPANSTGPLPGSVIRVVYPTEREVRDSLEGWRAGLSIPVLMNSCHPYINARLHRWGSGPSQSAPKEVVDVDAVEADGVSAEIYSHAMPHIKSYAAIAHSGPSGPRLQWLLVTSANLSKAAWGKLTFLKGRGKAPVPVPRLTIRSYELGVLYLPASAQPAGGSFSCTPSPAAPRLRVPVESSAPAGLHGVHIAAAGQVYLPYNILRPQPYASTAALLEQERATPGAAPPPSAPVPSQDVPWVVDAPHRGRDALGLEIGEAVESFNFYGSASRLAPIRDLRSLGAVAERGNGAGRKRERS